MARKKRPQASGLRPRAGAFAGKRVAIFGEFAIWPRYHNGPPAIIAAKHGAIVVGDLDERVDIVVFGDLRGEGRSEAKKKAARMTDLEILDEASFRDLVKIDVRGKRFAFIGGFDCSPSEADEGLLVKMVEAAGGTMNELDDKLDYLVVGNRRGPSKIALKNRAEKLIEAGAPIAMLDESAFLELVRVDKPAAGGTSDFAGFLSQLYGSLEEKKLGRALDMLRKDRFQLYSHLDDKHLVGVVRSQSGSGLYASWLTPEGHYGCSQPDLEDCMGLQGSPCKHLMVLVVGLARTGGMSLERALGWMHAAAHKPPRKNTELCASTFIQYKGAQAGEVDWRPTETIPEDFYAI